MPVIPAAPGEHPKGSAAEVPYSPLYDDIYHAAAGAWAQARHVFLGGNGLPGRWLARRRFVILETGFGLGNNFLATWSAWRRDARRCDHLVFISIEKHPLAREDMARVHRLDETATNPVDDEQEDRRMLAQRLVDAWPCLTPGMHTLHFDDAGAVPTESSHSNRQQVSLMLGLGDIADVLPSLVAQVDAFYLDGFAPARNPEMWDEGLLSRLNRLAAPGATAATWSAARSVRDGLAKAGFRVTRAPGFATKNDMVHACYEPRYTAPWPAGGGWPEPVDKADHHAIVLGAGLAGCSAALALCRAGWRVTLVDKHIGPAHEASGNAGGLFHSVLHGDDGVHARAHRAAALATWRLAAAWIREGRFQGDAKGLLRLDHKIDGDAARTLLASLGLPADHVQWLDLADAQARAGISVPSGGWLFHQAGWLHPAGFARAMLDDAASLTRDGQPLLRCLWQCEVANLSTSGGDLGTWQVRNARGDVIAEAPSLVLCNAMASQALLTTLPTDRAVAALPLDAVRGQVTEWQVGQLGDPPCATAATPPHLAVAGAGYVLRLKADTLLCGATTQLGDLDPALRQADHRYNLAQAARLGACQPLAPDAPLPSGLHGRTAWRASTPDRLPVIGALPWSAERLARERGRRRDQVRLLPRERGPHGGLYALTGLGSRGITWSCLAGELLAHWVTGGPCPVEAELRDAMDPARFLVRQMAKMPPTEVSDTTRMHTDADKD